MNSSQYIPKDVRCIVWDLETTGLNPYHDHIIEIAAMDNMGNSFQTLVASPIPLSYTIQKLTGIRDSDLLGQPDAHTALTQFKEFLEKDTRLPVYIIGHNSTKFDNLFIHQHFRTNGIEFPLNVRSMDTLLIAQFMYSDQSSYSLKALCESFHIKQNGAHRAMSDVESTYELFKSLLSRIQKKHQYDADRAFQFIKDSVYMG